MAASALLLPCRFTAARRVPEIFPSLILHTMHSPTSRLPFLQHDGYCCHNRYNVAAVRALRLHASVKETTVAPTLSEVSHDLVVLSSCPEGAAAVCVLPEAEGVFPSRLSGTLSPHLGSTALMLEPLHPACMSGIQPQAHLRSSRSSITRWQSHCLMASLYMLIP